MTCWDMNMLQSTPPASGNMLLGLLVVLSRRISLRVQHREAAGRLDRLRP